MKTVLDMMFAEVNTTNLRKSFYKKKDLIHGFNEQAIATTPSKVDEPIYDSHGEELVAHASKNTMNEMILANAK